MGKDDWSGATWVYHADLTNGGGSGTLRVDIVPAGGSEFWVMYGRLTNGDTVARTAQALITDGTNTISHFESASINAASTTGIPKSGQTGETATSPGRWFVSGTMQLALLVASVAGSQDATISVACRIRGAVPTATETVSSGGTATVNIEQVF